MNFTLRTNPRNYLTILSILLYTGCSQSQPGLIPRESDTMHVLTSGASAVRLLKALESGQTNRVLEILNSDLDSAILVFSQSSEAELSRMSTRDSILLASVIEYRRSHPRKAPAGPVDAAYDSAFQKLNSGLKRIKQGPSL